jgi:hypothetical protein
VLTAVAVSCAAGSIARQWLQDHKEQLADTQIAFGMRLQVRLPFALFMLPCLLLSLICSAAPLLCLLAVLACDTLSHNLCSPLCYLKKIEGRRHEALPLADTF